MPDQRQTDSQLSFKEGILHLLFLWGGGGGEWHKGGVHAPVSANSGENDFW